MIIRHNLPSKAFTKLDRFVFTDNRLSDGSKVLYGYLCGLRNGQDFSDKYILKVLQITQATLTRRKKELKDADLFFIDRIGLKDNLSPTRANGLFSMVKQMKLYALAYFAKQQKN